MPLFWIATGILSLVPLAAVVGYKAARPDGVYSDGLFVTVRPNKDAQPSGSALVFVAIGAFAAYKVLGK